MSKLYQENRNKVAVLKFIVLLTVIALLHRLVTYCKKIEIVKPIPNKPTIEAIDTFTKYGDLAPIYSPWTPDTTIGVPMHLGYLKEFGFENTTDTIVHWQAFPRLTWRWQESGFHVKEGRDTSYSLLPDSVPEPLFFEVRFIASGTELD